jgi:hypothetical protein
MKHQNSRGGRVPGAPSLDERLVIEVPGELVEKLDDVVDLLGFRSREEFALVALRQLLDKHVMLARFVQPDD